jgi:hypothetical protein
MKYAPHFAAGVAMAISTILFCAAYRMYSNAEAIARRPAPTTYIARCWPQAPAPALVRYEVLGSIESGKPFITIQTATTHGLRMEWSKGLGCRIDLGAKEDSK